MMREFVDGEPPSISVAGGPDLAPPLACNRQRLTRTIRASPSCARRAGEVVAAIPGLRGSVGSTWFGRKGRNRWSSKTCPA